MPKSVRSAPGPYLNCLVRAERHPFLAQAVMCGSATRGKFRFNQACGSGIRFCLMPVLVLS